MTLIEKVIHFLNLEDVKEQNSMDQCEVERSDKRMRDEVLLHMAEESPLSY